MQFSQYIIVYDISSNKERRAVDKILKSFGFRVQKSVFVCTLRRRDREVLRKKLEALEIETGGVIIYPIRKERPPIIIGENDYKDIDSEIAFVV